MAATRQTMPVLKQSLPTEEHTTPASNVLPRTLSRRDLTVLSILIVLFLSNTTGVQFGGPATFLYWGLGLLGFFIPVIMATQWLSKRFPGPGAPYNWAHRIFGAEWGFFTTFCNWVPGILVIVTASEAGLSFIQYLLPGWFTQLWQQDIAVFVFIVLATVLASIPLRYLKWLLLSITSLYLLAYAGLGLAGGWWLLSGTHHVAVNFYQASAWQLNSGNTGVFGMVILALLGINLPWAMRGELLGNGRIARRATSFVWISGIVSFIAYIAGTLGVMYIIPAAQAGSPVAPTLALQAVYGPASGNIATFIFILAYMAITTAYILVLSRLILTTAAYGSLPEFLIKVNRYGVPLRSILLQAVAALSITLIIYTILPYMFSTVVSPLQMSQEIYNVVMASVSTLMAFAAMLLFLFVLKALFHHIRHTRITQREKLFMTPFMLLGTATTLVAIYMTISTSWLPQWISDDYWRLLICGVTLSAIGISWLGSEHPRVRTMLSEQRKLTDNEITLRKEIERLYHEQAQAAVTDAVTGLPNHRAVMSYLDKALAQSEKADQACAVIFMDLDHFKRVNDTWGHRAGDVILREVGSRLRSTIREKDFVGRYGGEEFALVLNNTTIEETLHVAERLRVTVMSSPCLWQSDETSPVIPIPISGSFGVAFTELHGTDKNTLIECADRAMYRAKHTGRNRVCVGDDEAAEIIPVKEQREQQAEERSLGQVQEIVPLALIEAKNTRVLLLRALAEKTAQALDCSEEEFHLLHLMILLHNGEKLAFSEIVSYGNMLLQMKQKQLVPFDQPEIEAQMLLHASRVFEELSHIAIARNEHWDGQGLPLHLIGERIPLVARILAVIDAYASITAERSSQQLMLDDEIRGTLQNSTGSTYDPRVVRALLQVLSQFPSATHGKTLEREQLAASA